jgi:hypothetical protein
MERFAQQHRLVVTADNGQRVIDYLATTRRWRATGLAAGLAASLAWHLRQQMFGVNWVFMLAGWFLGALIAELRVARPSIRRGPSSAQCRPVPAASCVVGCAGGRRELRGIDRGVIRGGGSGRVRRPGCVGPSLVPAGNRASGDRLVAPGGSRQPAVKSERAGSSYATATFQPLTQYRARV